MEIYEIVNKLNGKRYIGKTKRSTYRRFEEHKKSTNDTILTRAFRKYGVENFESNILCYCIDEDDLGWQEIYYIDHYNTYNDGYNMTLGGEGGDCGNQFTKNPDIAKKKYDCMSEDERKDHIDNYYKGKNHYTYRCMSNEERNQWIENRSGENNSRYGYKYSYDERKKHSTRLTGRQMPSLSETHKSAISAANIGASNGMAKKYKIEYPDGRTEIITGLLDYCRNNNTTSYKLRKVCKVRRIKYVSDL